MCKNERRKNNRRGSFRWDRIAKIIIAIVAVICVGKVFSTILAKDYDDDTTTTTTINETAMTTSEANTSTNSETEKNTNLGLSNFSQIQVSENNYVEEATVYTVNDEETSSESSCKQLGMPVNTSVSTTYSSRLDRYMSEYEMYLLTMICCSEAGCETYEGKVAVVATVLNRMESGRFPNNIYGVIFEKDQFSSATNGVFHNRGVELRYEDINDYTIYEAECAVQDALAGVDPTVEATGGALYFYNPAYCSEEELAKRATLSCTYQIGNHIFYRCWD